MGDVIIALLDKMGTLHLSILLWITTGFIIYVLVLLGLSVRRFSMNIDRESKAIELSNQNTALTNQVNELRNSNDQSYESIQGLNAQIANFNNLIYQYFSNLDFGDPNLMGEKLFEIHSNSINILMSITDKIAPSNKSRVSYWVYNTDTNLLEGIARSTNFTLNATRTINPDGNTTRTLDLNQSIAGRAFRKHEVQFANNLPSDPDWKSYSTNQEYQCIIAIPIGDVGVVTIDFSKTPNSHEIELCVMYAKFFETQTFVYINELITLENLSSSYEEAAPDFSDVPDEDSTE